MEPFYVYAKPVQASHAILTKIFPNCPSDYDSEFVIPFRRAGEGTSWASAQKSATPLGFSTILWPPALRISPPKVYAIPCARMTCFVSSPRER